MGNLCGQKGMNMDFQKAIDLIDKDKNILIVPHTRPDGDACGSAVALSELFLHLGKKTEIILLPELPQWYRFLFAKEPTFFSKDFTADKLNAFDLIVLVDVNSKSQLPGLAELLEHKTKPLLVIDHHATNDGLGDVEIVDTTASAAGLIIYDLIKAAKWPLTKNVAVPLFVAISTDTGWFRFSNTDSRTHRACADLLDIGVNSADIYHTLYQSFSVQRFKLMTIMLERLELHFDGRFATQYILRKDFEQTGAADSDTENLIDECQRINTVEAAALFVELKDGIFRCSLRSRGAVDVRKIAQKFGGGGHAQAAGTYLSGPLENALQLILGEVSKSLP
jgi:phosphoesterase RecJ-like protein